MNNEFIKGEMQEATYKLKDGRVSSYYWQCGCTIFPNRFSISKNEFSKVQKKGRNNQPSTGQCMGSFKKDEQSPLKMNKPFTVRTQIWQYEDYPQFIGYGTCGITGNERKITDTGDLMVFFSDDNWKTIRILFFQGMGNPDNMADAFRYAAELI